MDAAAYVRFLIPNSLTLSRLVLAIAFPWLPVSWRLGVALFAGLTDLIDGVISRRFQATSVLGRVLDPIADKTFVLMVVATLLAEGKLWWWELILVGMRDLVVLAITVWVIVEAGWQKVGDMKPRLLGKIATGGQFFFLLSLLYDRFDVKIPFVLAALLSGLAAADYFYIFMKHRSANSTTETSKGSPVKDGA